MVSTEAASALWKAGQAIFVDVLPHEIVPYMNAQMDQAALAMQKKLGRSAA